MRVCVYRDSLEIFNGNIRVRVFRGPTRRKRSLLDQSSYEINGENARSYHDDEHSIDYNRNADRRNKYPYFHERRKRQQVDRVVIQGIDQVVRAVFQTDSSGTARGVSSTFEQITGENLKISLLSFGASHVAVLVSEKRCTVFPCSRSLIHLQWSSRIIFSSLRYLVTLRSHSN